MNKIDNNQVLVIVVDDQLNVGEPKTRLDTYKELLSLVNESLQRKWVLDVHFCHNLADIIKIEVEYGQPKLAFIDMVLNETWTSTSVSKLDQKLLMESWPLILVSARFGSEEAIERVNNLIGNTINTSVPSQFLMWSTIEKASNGLEVDELAFIIDSVLSRAQKQDLRFKKASEDTIDMLHITDPHFGKAAWDIGKLITLRVEREKAGLGVADFLAITGDIADQGTPKQYKLALKFFQALANHKIVVTTESGLPKDRVFLCPGNHDFSRRLALAANIEEGKAFSVSKTIKPENFWARQYAWMPYEYFESKIAGHQNSWIPNPGYRINSRFKNAGIIVLELNVERYLIKSYQEGVTDDELRNSLNEAANSIVKLRQSNECLIVLSHRHESNQWDTLAQIINSILSGLCSDGPVILMCGHEHSNEISLALDDKALFIRGMSPIDGASKPSQHLPMVNMVQLIRKKNLVSEVKVYSFYQEASRWLVSSDKENHYSYDFAKGRWQRD